MVNEAFSSRWFPSAPRPQGSAGAAPPTRALDRCELLEICSAREEKQK